MRKRKVTFGLILIFLGLFLWGRSLDLISFSFGDLIGCLFPVGLILLGIWLIIRKRRQEEQLRTQVHFAEHSDLPGATGPSAASDPLDDGPDTSRFAADQAKAAADGTDAQRPPRLSERPTEEGAGKKRYSKFLGDMFIDFNGIDMRNVEMSVGIGDLEIKLHGGKLSEGLNRIIISGFIGDLRVFIPPDMPFFAHCSNFIGDVEVAGRRASGFGNNLESQSANYDTVESKLYIAINSFIGDIRVYTI